VIADPFADALRRAAPGAVLERRGALAVLRVRDAAPYGDARTRAELIALANAHGVTHVALELITTDEAGDHPSLPRD
jgi:hypothetical protein